MSSTLRLVAVRGGVRIGSAAASMARTNRLVAAARRVSAQQVAAPMAARSFTVSAIDMSAAEPKKAAPKKAAAKKAAPKKTAKKATAKKAAPKKKVAKKAAKPKKKKVVKKLVLRKALTPEQKEAKKKRELLATIRSLKDKALMTMPEPKPKRSWPLYLSENIKPGVTGAEGERSLGSEVKRLAVDFKNMSDADKAYYTNTANVNLQANKVAETEWVQSHSAAQIYMANRARRALQRLRKEGKVRIQANRIKPIVDERIPKKANGAYVLYVKDQWATGRFSGADLMDASRRISESWKALSPADREVYESRNKAIHDEYAQMVEKFAEELKLTEPKADKAGKASKAKSAKSAKSVESVETE